jgi:hypothetical protein
MARIGTTFITGVLFAGAILLTGRSIASEEPAQQAAKPRRSGEPSAKVRITADDWFNTYYDELYFTGLGLGRGVHAYRNPAWHLLVRFAPRRDTEITVLDRYHDNPYRPSPTQLRQSRSGIVQPGDVKTFTTILLPHGPAFDVAPFAEWAQFVVDHDETTLVRVMTEFDNINHLRQTHWGLLQ